MNRFKDEDRWLPVSAEEMKRRGWDAADVIIVSGDAYVDHPSFGHAVIGRLIESLGFRVAILPQPNWRDDLRDFRKLGKPKLFFGITAGCMDSMVNHYTSFRRLRSDDAYTPGDKSGFRPDYACTVYSKILREIYPDVPQVLGGVEASLRRLTHYNYWSDQLMPGILSSAPADVLIYGQGVVAVNEFMERIRDKGTFHIPWNMRQIAYLTPEPLPCNDFQTITLPGHEECLSDKRVFAAMFRTVEQESNRLRGARLVQKAGQRFTVVNPPFPPLGEAVTDMGWDLPYTRLPHPRYQRRGNVPAWEMIRHSVNTHTGCFGGCSFCSVSMHQGRFIQSRSEASILREVEDIAKMPGFKGYISDLGGPSANMYRMKGINTALCESCRKPSCIFPSVCSNLNTCHGPLIELYRKAESVQGVKKVFISSGLRYDLFIGRPAGEDKQNRLSEYFTRLVSNHVSGRLKVAPEHTSPEVLKYMRKPSFALYRRLRDAFNRISGAAGLRQEILPYFISGHPGSKIEDMAGCAADFRELGLKPEQVQDFTPTPMTRASVMFYCGLDPDTGKPVYVAKSDQAKRLQKSFFFWYLAENRPAILRALKVIGRNDLIKKLFR